MNSIGLEKNTRHRDGKIFAANAVDTVVPRHP
jgi:hypothetical protein